ncbi:MAG: Zn-dependent oligopeptidase [Deltaproteobacteria bacterium]|jgi:thimet oligopeptidase|nr:Zn-dependent oligopeptidase [Deltaproteobacteria bacterium]
MFNRNLLILIIISSLPGLSGCEKDKKKTDPQPHKEKTSKQATDKVKDNKKTETKVKILPGIWNSVEDVEKNCKNYLDQADQLKQDLIVAKNMKDLEILQKFNEILIKIDAILPMSELITNVHPDEKVRKAGELCEQKGKKFNSKLELNKDIYKILQQVNKTKLDKLALRFLNKELLKFKRAGVNKDAETRKKLEALKEEMVKIGQNFSRNIKNDKKFILLSKNQLAGLPVDFIKAHKPDKNGKIKITTDYPDLFPVLAYAHNGKVRKKLYTKYLNRAYPDNEKILKKLLSKRHEYAKTLGYPNWASYIAEDKMVKTSKTISDFINKVGKLAKPRMKSDLKTILKRKKKDIRRASVGGSWDRFYYVKKVKAEKYGVDPEKVRSYFDFNKVKQGILETTQKIYDLEFKQDKNAPVWHKKVEVYNVYDNNKIIARFYLDLNPRKGKYGHAAEFTILSGIKGKQMPSAALVTNFPDPDKSEGPALMEHNQVVTFFHEFGHLMHQLLAGRQQWVNQSGITCEWDFVEAPSQLYEEWAWDAKVLAGFAKHHQTNQPIPAELVEKMRKAKEFGKGVHVMRQMFYAWLSYSLHAEDPAKLNLLQKIKKIQKKFSPYPHLKGTHVYANFGHLNGYSSMYYTYMWSLVMAKDLFSRFQNEGIMNTKTAVEYRKTILAPGGSVDAAAMVKNFLGRNYSLAAFENYLKK